MGQAASLHLSGVGSQLIKAIKAGDADAVTELVSRHPQLLRYCNLRQLGPCHYAAKGQHVEVLQQLVAKAQEVEQLQWQEAAANGAKVHSSLFGGGGGAPAQLPAQAHHRSSRERESLVKQLVNAASDRGVTPLMLAVDSGCMASIKLLLEKGADPWAADKLGARTALHYAARGDNPEVIQMLVQAAGSSGSVNFPNRPNTSYVDVRTQTGFTATHFAVQCNSQQALAALLNLGANPLLSTLFDCLDTINCPKGTTALHLAARHGNEAIVKQLLRAYVEHWYDRHLPDPRLLLDGDSLLPCQVTARRGHADLARLLLPNNPIHALFGVDDPTLVGPPTLAAIAGAVLRDALAGDLSALTQQQEVVQAAPQEAAAAAAEILPAAAAAPAAAQQAEVVVEAAECDSGCEGSANDSSSGVGDVVCGVCFDALPTVQLAPCGHSLCTDCCQHLLDMKSRCVMMCPFCRGGVAHLAPVEQAAAAAAAAAAPRFCTGPAATAAVPAPAMALSSGLQLVA